MNPLAASLLISAMGFAAPTFAATADAERDYGSPLTETYSQVELLKNWALASCLGEISADKHFQHETSLAQSGYLEYGKQDLESYDALHKEVKRALSIKASGSVEGDFTVMQCIDFFHSKPLDRLARKLVGADNKAIKKKVK